MKALAILYCFPPLLMPASLCYLKVVCGLRANGVEVEVVVISPRSFLPPGPGLYDASSSALVPDDVVQHVVWSPEANRAVRLAKRLLRTSPLGLHLFEPKKREWTYPARRRFSIDRLRDYDVLLTCSQPHANHVLGIVLQERANIPWVAYFSDPWSRNPYAQFRNDRVLKYNQTLESTVLTSADRVIYTSEEMLDLAREDHDTVLRDKSVVVPHSYVPQWYGPGTTSGTGNGPVRVLHTGHFYGPRSPAPLIRALGRLRRRRELDGKLRIDSYGNMAPGDVQAVADEGLQEVFKVGATVPYASSLALMKQYDVLLLIDAALQGLRESVFLPSKLIDYLGAGKGVIAITPTRGATARVVREVGGVVCGIDDEREIEAVFERLIDGEVVARPNPEVVSRYDYVNVGRRLVDVMDALIRGARPDECG